MPERHRIALVPVRDILFLRAEQKYVTVSHAQPGVPDRGAARRLGASSRRAWCASIATAWSRAAIRGFERAPGEEDEAHWLVQLDGVEEKRPVSRRQWPLVRELVT